MAKDQRKQQVTEARNEVLKRIGKLEGPNFFTEAVGVPTELAAALIAGRPELLKAVRPRPLTADECELLYKLIATLIETNMALRDHAREVSQMTKNLMGGFTTIHNVALQIEHFANFQQTKTEEEED